MFTDMFLFQNIYLYFVIPDICKQTLKYIYIYISVYIIDPGNPQNIFQTLFGMFCVYVWTLILKSST